MWNVQAKYTFFLTQPSFRLRLRISEKKCLLLGIHCRSTSDADVRQYPTGSNRTAPRQVWLTILHLISHHPSLCQLNRSLRSHHIVNNTHKLRCNTISRSQCRQHLFLWPRLSSPILLLALLPSKQPLKLYRSLRLPSFHLAGMPEYLSYDRKP